MDIVPRKPIRIGDEDLVERGHGRPIAEPVEAGPLERGAAVAVVTEDVPLGQRPAPRLEMGPQPVDLLLDGLCLGLSLGRDTYTDRDSHWCPPTRGSTTRDRARGAAREWARSRPTPGAVGRRGPIVVARPDGA